MMELMLISLYLVFCLRYVTFGPLHFSVFSFGPLSFKSLILVFYVFEWFHFGPFFNLPLMPLWI